MTKDQANSDVRPRQQASSPARRPRPARRSPRDRSPRRARPGPGVVPVPSYAVWPPHRVATMRCTRNPSSRAARAWATSWPRTATSMPTTSHSGVRERRAGAEVAPGLPAGPGDERGEEQPGAVEVDRHARDPARGAARPPVGATRRTWHGPYGRNAAYCSLAPAADPKRPHVTPQHRPDATADLTAALRERVLVLDGAMGTMIQGHGLSEADYRGERFADHRDDQQGNNDLLSITQPEIIRGVHRAYLEAGADLLETNTFNAQRISLGRLRPAGTRLRAQRRRGLARPRRGRRDDRAHARPAPLGAGHARPHEPHGIHLPRRQRPRRPQRHLRRARRGLPRAGPRPRRRRRRRAARRDDLRHPQRQGRRSTRSRRCSRSTSAAGR